MGDISGPVFEAWVHEHCGCLVEIVKRSDDQTGFVILSRRWVVVGTLDWFSCFRHLSKVYERLAETSEAWTYTAMIRVMLKRLANNPAVYC